MTLLTDDEVELIHHASLELLENIGTYVPLNEVLKMLSDNGAHVDYEKNVARIPPEIVMEYVRKAPHEFTLYGRDPKWNMTIKPGNFYFGFGAGTTQYWDYETGAPRNASLGDLEKLTKLADTLDNFSYLSELVTPVDVPPELTGQYQWACALKISRKHLGMYVSDAQCVRDGVRMASAVAGSEKELTKKPIVSFIACVGQPLTYEKGLLSGMVEVARSRLPIFIHSGAMAGATGPVTLAGTLALCNAEILSGIVLAEMVNPGNPVICTNFARIFDMKAANVSLASPEFALCRIAAGQIVRQYYNLPFCSSCFQTDAKNPGIQQGYEKYITLISMLSGASLLMGETVAGASFTDPVGWVIDDELAAGYLKFMRGLEVNTEALALDVIRSVGVGGGRSFLQLRHTRDHLRDHWLDYKLLDRRSHSAWERAGGKDLRQKAREKLEEKLKSYRLEELPKNVQNEISNVLTEARLRQGHA